MASSPAVPTRSSTQEALRFRFDRGLDSVTQQDAPPPQLPDGRATPAPDIRSQAALERLLGANDLSRLVDAAIRPAIDDPGLLLPGRFADALQMAQASLRRSLAGRRTDGGRRERRLRQAVNVLEEQEALLALLWTYRHALYQG
jgi:hypothetical protein